MSNQRPPTNAPTSTSTSTATPPTAPQEKPIPRLTSIAPAIFVPLTTNLLEPFTPPSTPGDILQANIANVDADAAAVRANLIALFRRECVRIERDAQAREVAYRAEHPGVSLDPCRPAGLLGLDELEFLLAKVHSPHDPALDYNLPDSVIPWPEFTFLPTDTPRERAAKEIMELISRAMIDLKGFDGHVAQIREDYRQVYKKEQERRFQQ